MKLPFIALALLLALSACGEKAIYKPTEVDIPIPMPCKQPVPDSPAWPTLALSPDAGILAQTRATLAELELRKGYESALLASLQACI